MQAGGIETRFGEMETTFPTGIDLPAMQIQIIQRFFRFL